MPTDRSAPAGRSAETLEEILDRHWPGRLRRGLRGPVMPDAMMLDDRWRRIEDVPLPDEVPEAPPG